MKCWLQTKLLRTGCVLQSEILQFVKGSTDLHHEMSGPWSAYIVAFVSYFIARICDKNPNSRIYAAIIIGSNFPKLSLDCLIKAYNRVRVVLHSTREITRIGLQWAGERERETTAAYGASRAKATLPLCPCVFIGYVSYEHKLGNDMALQRRGGVNVRRQLEAKNIPYACAHRAPYDWHRNNNKQRHICHQQAFTTSTGCVCERFADTGKQVRGEDDEWADGKRRPRNFVYIFYGWMCLCAALIIVKFLFCWNWIK